MPGRGSTTHVDMKENGNVLWAKKKRFLEHSSFQSAPVVCDALSDAACELSASTCVPTEWCFMGELRFGWFRGPKCVQSLCVSSTQP